MPESTVALKKKICMVGHFGVGKTSLVRRFVETVFDERYHTTVGVKIDRKDVNVGSRALTLMLWDMAGEDQLAQVKLSHIQGASGYILVADGCQSKTMDTAFMLQQRIGNILGPLPFVLALNKADLRDQWEVKPDQVQALGWPMFETSARLGTGVEELFWSLAGLILENDSKAEDQDA